MDIKNEIKGQIILSKEIGKYITVKQKGNLSWACCPFHKEKTPSFCINDEKAFFYCFGCGEQGDVFSFLCKFNNQEFLYVLEDLADRFGLKVLRGKNYKDDLEILKLLENYYCANLKTNSKVLEYLKKRDIKEETIEKFHLGFAGDGAINFLLCNGVDYEVMQRIGIVGIKNQDRLMNRLIFPIKNRRKDTIGFAGRVLDDSLPKYINYQESAFFQKSMHLYNENHIIPGEAVIIVEGYFDVIKLTQANFKNVLASMGTSISIYHLHFLFGLTDKIFLMFDGDAAGRKSLFSNLKNFLKCIKPGKSIRICFLSENCDPDDLVENLSFFIYKSVDLFQWIIEEFKPKDSNMDSRTKSLEDLEDLAESINHPLVQQEFRKLIPKTFSKNYNFLPVPLNPIKEIIGLFLQNPEIFCEFIEDLMLKDFKEDEPIKNYIIDEYALKSRSLKKVRDEVLKQFNVFSNDLMKNYQIYYIIKNKDFIVQYIKDLLSCILSKGVENE